jgi:hypothetical protein
MWDKCVIDATMGARDGMLCFCPVELDENDEITAIVTGMNFVGSPPGDCKVIGVVHEGGQAAVDEFYEEHKALIEQFFAPRESKESA